MKQNRILLCIILFLMIFNILVPVLYAQQPLSGMSEEERNQKIKQEIERVKKEREKFKHPKVSEALVELEEAYKNGMEEAAKKFQDGKTLIDKEGKIITTLADAKKKGGEGAAEKTAEKHDLEITEGNKIRVHIVLETGISADLFDKTVLQSYGVQVIKGRSNLLQVDIPIENIRKIADEVEGILFIKIPSKFHPESYQSEGISITGASNYHSSGYDGTIQDGSPNGTPVKIAVIDSTFNGLAQASDNGDIPINPVQLDCTLSSCVPTTFSSPPIPSQPRYQHGTAVAEIIYDMAPKAQLYLLKINDEEDLATAVTYCINNHIKIINFSGGFFNTNFFDGSAQYFDGICLYSNPVCSANDAYANGILFVKSVGNYATQHYKATYTDVSDDGWHDTVLTIGNAQANSKITVYLNWDAWGIYNNDDYHVYLFDSSWGIANEGTPDPSNPTEYFSWTVDITDDYYLYIVKNNAATPNRIFKVYSLNHNITQAVAASSLSSPADAAGAIAVGAIDYRKWTAGNQESYSSQGPTMDNRTKPDIAGPDFVTTYTYGTNGFPGTSAAAPHVAGAAALILSKSGYSVSQLWSSLTGSAIPMLSNESNCYGFPNNCYGSGRLQLPALYNINVTKTGTGSGTVTSNITGINCGSDCSDSYISGTTVTLTATPDAGSLFQWSGACSGTGSCPLTMNGNKAVTATFYMPNLSVSKTGPGNGTITSSPAGVDCGATCSANFNAGTPVTLNVSPDTGSTFLGWSGGGCSGTGSCIITMSDSASVSTSFGVNMATCPNSVARTVGKANYSSLQNAYNAAVDGDTIQSQAVILNENVNANRNISVTIDGGYNCYYSSNPGSTALKGSLTTNSGTVNIKNFNLQF